MPRQCTKMHSRRPNDPGPRLERWPQTKRSPAETGLLGLACDLGRQFFLEPESDDGDGDVLWFALGWLAVDELPLCEGA